MTTTLFGKTVDKFPGVKTCHVSEATLDRLLNGHPIRIRLLNRPENGTMYALTAGWVTDLAEVLYTEVADVGDSETPEVYTVVLMQTARSFATARGFNPTAWAKTNPPLPDPE